VKKIVVIGTGRMGGAFATAFAKRTSHAVSIRGSHAGSSSAAALSRQLGVRVADDKELLAADIVFVATPPAALDDVAEQLARLVPKGRVVTAFTSISSALIRDTASGEKPTVFTCADNQDARSTVIALAKEIGFEGVDAGHLDASPNIENLGLLVGQLAYGSGLGNRVALRAYVTPRPVRRARPGKGSTVPKRRRNP
jgi:predicted dinucleotide-binding enzyme